MKKEREGGGELTSPFFPFHLHLPSLSSRKIYPYSFKIQIAEAL